MLTAPQVLKLELLRLLAEAGHPEYLTDATRVDKFLDDVYYAVVDDDDAYDALQEIEQEYRSGTHETDRPCWASSRHYVSKSVARKIGDTWVGWTYWYGGGKHGEPSAVEWIEDAYFLTATERIVTAIEFRRVP